MYIRLLFILLTTFSFSACQQEASTSAKYTAEEIAEQDQAWAAMMEGHDRAMPLMGDLHRAAAQLETVVEQHQVQANDIHPKAVVALKDLETAADGMMDWMAGISDYPLDSLRSKYSDHAAVMADIDKETTTIEAVEQLMNSSLTSAKELLASPPVATPKPE